MKEDWIKKMSQKLEGHQMDPPSGLWDNIARQMDISSTSVRKPIVLRLRYWISAAVVLLLVGFFAYHAFNSKESSPLQKRDIQATVPAEETPETIPNFPVSQNNLDCLASPYSIGHFDLQESVTTADDYLYAEDEVQERRKTQSLAVEEGKANIADNSHLLGLQKPREEEGLVKHHHPSLIQSTPEKNGKWLIGVNTSGGLFAMGSPIDHYSKVYMYYKTSTDTYLGTSGNGIYTRAPFRSESKSLLTHHLPVRFGLSLSYQLNQRIALISGLNYTYLHSEHVIPQENLILNNQRFHYLGIPLGVSWKVWSARRFSLYLSSRTMLEKCLNARQWQWSVHASSGVDFSFIPQLSLYLEPSVGYYFDDGSSYKHYYKDHPLAPTFEIGLRLHLGNK